MELPALPDECGHSVGVRKRVERSFPAIRAAVGFTDVVTEALERQFGEWLRRLADRDEVAGDGGRGDSRRERYISVPDFLLHTGLDLERIRDEMVRADLALEERRRIRRRAIAERDGLKRELYDALVRFKKEARSKLGKRFKVVLSLKGETVRDPVELSRRAGHAVQWASGPNAEHFGLPVDWLAMAAPMAPLVKDLDAANDVVAHEHAAVNGALADRIKAMEAFDDWYGKGSRALEATYVLLGLPTLAAAVRPQLKVAGRVGRPSKLPPVDAYPDLVERVRAAGLLPAEAEQAAPEKSDEQYRLAAWMATYREAIGPYLSFLASLSARPRGSKAAKARSVAAWPARVLTRWRKRDAS